jgi:hypothetical protein
MTAPVIDLDAYRRSREIVVRLPVYYTDARLEFARRVEQRAYELECADALKYFAEAMAGSDSEDKTPCA